MREWSRKDRNSDIFLSKGIEVRGKLLSLPRCVCYIMLPHYDAMYEASVNVSTNDRCTLYTQVNESIIIIHSKKKRIELSILIVILVLFFYPEIFNIQV